MFDFHRRILIIKYFSLLSSFLNNFASFVNLRENYTEWKITYNTAYANKFKNTLQKKNDIRERKSLQRLQTIAKRYMNNIKDAA